MTSDEEWYISIWADHTPYAGRPSSVYIDRDDCEIEICRFPEETELTPEEESANAFAVAYLPEAYEVLRQIKEVAELMQGCGATLPPDLVLDLLRKVPLR